MSRPSGRPPENQDEPRTPPPANEAAANEPAANEPADPPVADPHATRASADETLITPEPRVRSDGAASPAEKTHGGAEPQQRAAETRRWDGTSGDDAISDGEASAGSAEPSDEDSLDEFAGLTMFGRYLLKRELGRGGMGRVYLARDTQLNRDVALKVPSQEAAANPQLAERFLTEARAAATLRHPYLCPVFDAGHEDGQLFITMAYIEGRTLRDAVEGPQPIGASVRLIGRLADAMAHAHERGVIHRDLKPGNVMLDEDGKPAITDFGLARLDAGEEGATRVTATGTTLGTPAYMSPEQIAGEPDEIGPQTDIYALGVILYGLLTGRPPFDGPPSRVMAKAYSEDPPPPSQVRAEERSDLPPVPEALESIWRRMVARDQTERYRTMREVRAALAGFSEGGAVETKVGEDKFSNNSPGPEIESEPAFAELRANKFKANEDGGSRNRDSRRNARLFWTAAVLAALALVAAGVIWLPDLGTSSSDAGAADNAVSGIQPVADMAHRGEGESTDNLAAADEDWVELFDGKSLDGWVGDPDVWSVKDGVLVGRGAPLRGKELANGNEVDVSLQTEGYFDNARIRLVYRSPGWYFSGIRARYRPNEDGGVLTYTYNGHPMSGGGQFRRMDRNPAPTLYPAPNAERAFEAQAQNGEPEGWDVLTVEIVGGDVRSFRNGVPIDHSLYPDLPRSGHITLRLVRNDAFEVGTDVRSIRVLPLDENGKPVEPPAGDLRSPRGGQPTES